MKSKRTDQSLNFPLLKNKNPGKIKEWKWDRL
jgi:hypothetical protein